LSGLFVIPGNAHRVISNGNMMRYIEDGGYKDAICGELFLNISRGMVLQNRF